MSERQENNSRGIRLLAVTIAGMVQKIFQIAMRTVHKSRKAYNAKARVRDQLMSMGGSAVSKAKIAESLDRERYSHPNDPDT